MLYYLNAGFQTEIHDGASFEAQAEIIRHFEMINGVKFDSTNSEHNLFVIDFPLAFYSGGKVYVNDVKVKALAKEMDVDFLRLRTHVAAHEVQHAYQHKLSGLTVDAFEDLCISEPSVAIRYEMEAVIMATVASLHDTSEEYIQQVLLDSAELTVDQLIASEYHNTADYDKEYLLDVYLDAVRGYLKELAV